ncbi:helix-turn-helix domain-containing protein [Sphingomonas aerophila]|uniref:Excisionase family DNA binding protein n=1 Tax=Sphingomonas aerophila TaxID=1344948 RepID=A0A7W9BG71_9SPHN|nr:helix-turn-helix domain-containing protein [Sphingomonas aerophila]MBB5716607.1 excisionase family DNA binding protein [Sphingomonas aerophila]
MQRFSVSIDEAARAIGIGRTKLYELINSGSLDVIRIGSRTLVKVPSIEAMLQRSVVF